MSSEDHTVSFSLEVNVDKAYEDVRRVQTVLYRTLDLVRRASGSESLDKLTRDLQEALAMANRLRLALAALQAARAASGDPIAIAMAAVSIGEALFSAGDLIMESG